MGVTAMPPRAIETIGRTMVRIASSHITVERIPNSVRSFNPPAYVTGAGDTEATLGGSTLSVMPKLLCPSLYTTLPRVRALTSTPFATLPDVDTFLNVRT
jgi:hypothetical protein